jgi:hypothetical protein
MQEVAAVEFICKLIWGNRRKYPTVGTQVEAKDGPTKRKPECKNYTKQRAYLTSIQDFGLLHRELGAWIRGQKKRQYAFATGVRILQYSECAR